MFPIVSDIFLESNIKILFLVDTVSNPKLMDLESIMLQTYLLPTQNNYVLYKVESKPLLDDNCLK